MITLAEKLLTGSGAGVLEVKGYVEFVSSTPMTITPKYTNTGVKLLYSLDGTTWTPIVNNKTTPSANIIYFIGQATGSKSLYSGGTPGNEWIFTGATNLECNGKLDRLLQDNLGGDDDILTIAVACYSYMFYCVSTLIKAPELPAITLADYCYHHMFFGCTSLTTAPELPATTLAPNCYFWMFLGCSNLTTPPPVLPATTLATKCYEGMFRNCTSLTTPPAMPATTLATNCCYWMFRNCTSLTTPPAMPATTLATNCYAGMFKECTSLTKAPKLPATTLVDACYYEMFFGCTNLTTLPELPATTLAHGCYQDMFYGCTSLKLSTTLTGIYDTAYRIPTTGTGITATNPLVNMFTNTGGTFKGTPIINTTYYTENTPI